MSFQVGVFKTYVPNSDVRLGFTEGKHDLVAGRPFEFDGQTVRFPDGVSYGGANGIRTLIANNLVQEVAVKSPAKKASNPKPKKDEGFEELVRGLGSVESNEDDDGEIEDTGVDMDSEIEFGSESDDDEMAEFRRWKAAKAGRMETEDDDDIDAPEPFRVRGPEIRPGIHLDRRQSTVPSTRQFPGSNHNMNMEQSAKAQVGSLVNPHSSGVQVGRPGQTKTAFEVARPGDTMIRGIAMEQGATVREVGILNFQTRFDGVDVTRVGSNIVNAQEAVTPSRLPVQYVGAGAKAAATTESMLQQYSQQDDHLIPARQKKIAEIQKKHPKFSWDLRAAATQRFEQIMGFWTKGQTNAASKRTFDLIMSIELPMVVDRVQKEIEYRLSSPRG